MTRTILTSMVGLGTYLPAVYNQRELMAHGEQAEVEIIESHYATPDRLRHDAAPALFGDNIALAQLSQRMVADVGRRFDAARIDAMLARWLADSRRSFIVWSGQWMAILRRYATMVPAAELSIDLCRIDAVPSPSFRRAGSVDGSRWRDIWLVNEASGRVEHRIDLGTGAPVGLADRDPRLVVHGGGWALGGFRDAAAELDGSYDLDVVVPAEAAGRQRAEIGGQRHFTMEARWFPPGPHTRPMPFPPLLLHRPDGSLASVDRCDDHVHALHQLSRTALAIVSKPGGATLIDSLAGATPVVFLDPLGAGEAANARVWCSLGYGVTLAQWRTTGFDRGVLAASHARLLDAANKVRAYPDRFCNG